MNFDYLYFLSFVFFFICFASLGYRLADNLRYKSIFQMFSQEKKNINISKFINFEIYLESRDYIPYEKYEIWRFYFPS